MVTRVDKKPIIYGTTMLRVFRPAVTSLDRKLLKALIKRAVGHRIPDLTAKELLEVYEDVDAGMKLYGVDDPVSAYLSGYDVDPDDEAVRIARTFMKKNMSTRQMFRNEQLMEEICKVQKDLLDGVDKIYYGTEAVYQVYARILNRNVFEQSEQPNYVTWAISTAKAIMTSQSTQLLLHPAAVNALTSAFAQNTTYLTWEAWDIYKRTETLAIKLSSRKSFLAHNFYAGSLRKEFEPSAQISDDFLLPTSGYCETQKGVKVYVILGIRYFKIHGILCALSHDDCISLSTMAQCYFRTCMYFNPANGYSHQTCRSACTLISDMVTHCCKLIDSGRNFSNFIRSIHILAQGEFNDAYELKYGGNYGWEVRSENYVAEAKLLDESAEVFYARAMELAIDEMDRMNTSFIYHALVGDEMLITDLRQKVIHMTDKVRDADADEWARFLRFCKAYFLSRFMYIHKRKPRVKGDISQLNMEWAESCISGKFRMPTQADWGRVWIDGEFRYSEFADLWHLECQDVAYVVKDSQGLKDGIYTEDRAYHSELLMAMQHGNILDVLTGSTSKTARERIVSGRPPSEVVLTCAPKAENAKPSWKKRVTFAADCEFRKMQSEVDKNCRRVMSFVRGPSLGVDQCILEKQFADIAWGTRGGYGGVVCSHDISAWSESMDRKRKFEFEQILLNMFDCPRMINIANDWEKICAVILKQGSREVSKISNGSFQGFDGSASTILHSMILIYCIDSARRKDIIPPKIRTNMATLIDDCIALMVDLTDEKPAKDFWDHLKEMYLKLGFEIDDLKSVFSNIKAIYLSRRFVLGGEVPADYKIYLKAHSSYEDPLRNVLDAIQDIYGGLRGAADANGETWYIYYSATLSALAELAHSCNFVTSLPPYAAAIFALCPTSDNGWGFPSMLSWCTNDVVDKLCHFNAMIEANAAQMCASEEWIADVNVLPLEAIRAIHAIKCQPWRQVSYASIFTSPFEAIREGPLRPDMLKRNAIQDILKEYAVAHPWKGLLQWNNSATTERVRELLITSGPLHAPTLAALVHCMPDNFRLSLVGKGVGSQSLFNQLAASERMILKRRINRAAVAYFKHSVSIYLAEHSDLEPADLAAMTFVNRTMSEREEFFACNGVEMTDHTFPDPVMTFTSADKKTGSVISPNLTGVRLWDFDRHDAVKTSHYISTKGIYVPRRSGRVWEVTCEYANGWDTVSQRVSMGLAILARAEADGHQVNGLLHYFTKAWNEFSNITPADTQLISIHGSLKRLDANPGSSTHPIIVNRNILRGFNNTLKTALDAIPIELNNAHGSPSHLHDTLAHETGMLCITALIFSCFRYLEVTDHVTCYNVVARKGCLVRESPLRMKTNSVAAAIQVEILDGADDYGLLQACPDLAEEIAIPTMRAGWVDMVNALLTRNTGQMEDLRRQVKTTDLQSVLDEMADKITKYSPAVILAAPPSERHSQVASSSMKITYRPVMPASRAVGDSYMRSVKPIGSRFTREVISSRPAHAVAAICIKSILWERLKSENMQSMAKILYNDPDCDIEVLRRCASVDFWRGIAIEASKYLKDTSLSDLVMSAFRSLGLYEVHIKHTNDVKDVAQSLASYFGSHIKSVCTILSDKIAQFAGRVSKDYEKPVHERVICYNPGVTNARMKQAHMKRLIKSVAESYKDRLLKLCNESETHRGDVRACQVDRFNRIDDIWARLNVYQRIGVYNKGDIQYPYARIMYGVVKEACLRTSEDKEPELMQLLQLSDEDKRLPINDNDPLDCRSKLEQKDFFDCFEKISMYLTASGEDPVWDDKSCEMGSRLALQTIELDSGNVAKQTFAVSPSEFAPSVHKRLVTTRASEPRMRSAISGESEEEEVEGLAFGSMSVFDFTESALEKALSRPMTLKIDAWKGLYACLYRGVYSPEEVNAALGTEIGDVSDPATLREAHLEDFSDDQVYKAFPSLVGDFYTQGLIFDDRWLDRDEADAYTTDELFTAELGFLL